jgi:formylmethanofuran dehydrogenase subunit E
MSEMDILLNKAKEFHGEVCAGIILGTRMTIAGMKDLGMNPQERNRYLIVYVENDRCVADAIQAITGCSLGHRTLKYLPYGKFAATFVDLKTGAAVRVSIADKTINDRLGTIAVKDISPKALLETPESDLFHIQRVNCAIPDDDMPGLPKHKAYCSNCNEVILDNKVVVRDGVVLCINCAGEPYYMDLV